MMEDVGNEEQAFLSTLGVTTANPEDIERHVIAEIQQKARDGQNMPAGEAQEETIAADSVNDNVRDGFLVQKRLHTHLAALEQEIDAVAAGLESFQGDELNMEEEAANPIPLEYPGESRNKTLAHENMKQNFGAGGTFLHRALVEDRLQSLKRKKKHLNKHLKFLEQDEAFASGNIEAGDHSPSNNSLQGRPKAAEDTLGSVNQTKKEKKSISLFDDDDLDSALNAASGFVETERERLIRTGVLTPFDKVRGFERRLQTSGPENGFLVHRRVSGVTPNSNGQIEDPLVRDSVSKAVASIAAIAASRPTTKLVDSRDLPRLEPPTREFRRLRKPVRVTSEGVENKLAKQHVTSSTKRRRPLPDKQWRIKKDDDSTSEGLEENKEDDFDELNEEPISSRTGGSKHQRLQMKVKQEIDLEDSRDKSDTEENSYETDVVLEGGLKVPGKIFHNLFDYQKTGVKWLWELHCQKAGGIIGDEMGLGKTIQVIAFLAALHHSGMYKPSLVVCPVTLARQWKREVQKWYPAFNAEILHISAHGVLSRSNKSQKEELKTDSDSNSDGVQEIRRKGGSVLKGADRWDSLIEHVKESESGLLITTYEQLRLLKDKILDHQWGYAILDEGHRIRNPDAETTLVCKQLQTVHRIIMTGAPIQNKLTELWSLFDFVFPGKLGVLPVFQAQFALPIAIGGYANATPLQVSTAYKCAVVLRDLVMPYLLRRMKSDVEANLPKKTEHVLFCSLTEDQRSAYRAFLTSSEVEQIFDGSRNSLYGIDILRKICNHPDLLERDHSGNHPDYGNPERSGKLKVVSQVLKLWKKQGHRVLLFSQTQQMLDIIEDYVSSEEYVYRRMDGATPIAQRMALIDEFNQSEHVFVFILTTKVGGLGTNLVGANRVIIYDPDWNPSTDMQARERAWRIGQTRDVTVYRLIMRGTIEEKVYHRQIYKHFLTNKILRDPQQRRFFKARDMRDLFVLQDDTAADKTETSTLFSEVGGEINLTEQVRQEDFEDNANAKPDNKKSHKISDQSASTSKKRKRKSDCDTAASGRETKGKEKVEPEEDKAEEDDARILQSLFDANGIHSAMDHDAILSINDSEKMKLDHEANRVAQRAADALRQSRMMRATDHIAVPTWTGRSGEAGAPAAVRRRFGSTLNSRLISSSVSATESNQVTVSRQAPASGLVGSLGGKALSSSDLLTRMRERRLGVASAGINSLTGDRVGFSSGSAPQPVGGASSRKIVGQSSHESDTLIQQLIAYFWENGGSTSSSSVVEHFKEKILPAEVPKFKQLLKQVATLHKEEAEESKWHLKQEYKVTFKC
ncbi:hypothetical protein O6H91_07G103800 [Diphasiastrum complanatum]|uniref:Uncharacterized protein n=3 Tax=Diphasiastrum complanatum TaxID=34168 RepID=A0ACC2D865_DIPCM|nr:hypothetical protein O6H91_07G103800 [Diphasiastrum complanatum]KAJ7550500.1 hypothetical protein O6H91_07G103800 [Diphasiastrum complanatum]KAJ7550501.1 hypothetical protein O6H91_07G103800 [Diphasiastrum complanatum]